MADIPINDIDPINGYTAAGGETGYAFSFPIFASGDLTVLEILTNGTVNTLIEGTDYSVAGVNVATGGTITFDLTAYPTGATAGARYVLFRDLAVARSSDFLTGGDFKAETVNRELDKIIMMIQQNELDIKRSLSLKKEDAEDELKFANESAADRQNRALQFNATGDEVEAGPTVTDIENAASNATAAANSATDAANSATAAATSETNAANSATAAQAAVESQAFRDVVFLTNADSPYTVDQDDNGKFFNIDTSGGAVVINLPEISGLTLPFNATFKKNTNDANTVTVNRGGSSDLIDGGTSKTQQTIGGFTAIPDTDGTPDTWTTASFGAAAGDMEVDVYTDGVGFTAGTSTQITLSQNPGSENNVWIKFDGLEQDVDQYSVSGTTVTFTEAIPAGTKKIQARYGTTLSIGTPGNGTVGEDQLADLAVTFGKTNMLASVAQAQAGTANQAFMSPLRVAQAIAALTVGNELQSIETVETDVDSVVMALTSSGNVSALGPTVAITPQRSDSKVRIEFNFTLGINQSTIAQYQVYKDGVAWTKYQGDARGNRRRFTGGISREGANRPVSFTAVFEDEPGDTSEHTYELRFASFLSATLYLNRASTDTDSTSYFTGVSLARATEIAQ